MKILLSESFLTEEAHPNFDTIVELATYLKKRMAERKIYIDDEGLTDLIAFDYVKGAVSTSFTLDIYQIKEAQRIPINDKKLQVQVHKMDVKGDKFEINYYIL